jgi:outer membrane protein assembly factor BamD
LEHVIPTPLPRLLKSCGLGLFLFLLVGCSLPFSNTEIVEKTPGPEALFDKAQGFYQDHEYEDAIHFFETLKSAYPQFEKMPFVQMRVADSYYRMGEYHKAMAEYSQFVTLYPTDPNVARAQYMIGMSYYKRKKSIDRDDSVVRRAEEIFRVVVDEYGDTPIGKQAKERLLDCRKRLAEKELYKAGVYMSMGKYKAAEISAQRILEEYSGLGFDDDANEIIESVKDE